MKENFAYNTALYDKISPPRLSPPGSQHQIVVRWGHVTVAPHWGQNKSRTLLLIDHSGPPGHSLIPSLDCQRHPESHAHLQIEEEILRISNGGW